MNALCRVLGTTALLASCAGCTASDDATAPIAPIAPTSATAPDTTSTTLVERGTAMAGSTDGSAVMTEVPTPPTPAAFQTDATVPATAVPPDLPFDPSLFLSVDPDHVILPDPVPVPADAPPPLGELLREGLDAPPVGEEFERLWVRGQLDNRSSFGLPATAAAVEAARAAGSADLFGLALLPEEQAVVDRQLAFQAAVDPYLPEILQAAGEHAAGSFHSPGDDLGGQYTLLLYRSDLTADDLTAGTDMPDDLRARIRVAPGALPVHYVRAIQGRIHQTLYAAGIPSHSAADEVRVRIQVMVGTGRTGEAVAALSPGLASFVDWVEGEGIGNGPWGDPVPSAAP